MSLPKSESLSAIQEFVGCSRTASEHHEKEILGLEAFFEFLAVVVRKEIPEFVSSFSFISENFRAALQKERNYVHAEERFAEDLNDINARSEVVHRISVEAAEAQLRVKALAQKIAALRKDLAADIAKGGPNRYQIEEDIQAELARKRMAREHAIAKLEEHLTARQRFNTFKARRLRHAYENMGKMIVLASRGTGVGFERISRSFAELRTQIEPILDGKVAEDEYEYEEEEAEPAQKPPALAKVTTDADYESGSD
jgi:hypothetical protein